jgi:chitinase
VHYCLLQPIPASKILLGIPCYGRSFPSSTGPYQTFSKAVGDGEETVEYLGLPLPGAQTYIDEKAVAAYCVEPDGGHGFVSYDVPWTVKAKARYVKECRLGGLFYWTGTGDRVDGCEEVSLVMAGYCELHR